MIIIDSIHISMRERLKLGGAEFRAEVDERYKHSDRVHRLANTTQFLSIVPPAISNTTHTASSPLKLRTADCYWLEAVDQGVNVDHHDANLALPSQGHSPLPPACTRHALPPTPPPARPCISLLHLTMDSAMDVPAEVDGLITFPKQLCLRPCSIGQCGWRALLIAHRRTLLYATLTGPRPCCSPDVTRAGENKEAAPQRAHFGETESSHAETRHLSPAQLRNCRRESGNLFQSVGHAKKFPHDRIMALRHTPHQRTLQTEHAEPMWDTGERFRGHTAADAYLLRMAAAAAA